MERLCNRWRQEADALRVEAVENHDHDAQRDRGDLKAAQGLVIDDLSDGKPTRFAAHDWLSIRVNPVYPLESSVIVRVHWNGSFSHLGVHLLSTSAFLARNALPRVAGNAKAIRLPVT